MPHWLSGLFCLLLALPTAALSAPTVSLTSPANGATSSYPGSFTIAASASGPASIFAVDFYSNGVFVQRDRTSPYSIVLQNLNPGSYSLTAVATDTMDAVSAPSAARVVTVTSGTNAPPTVTLTGPANGASATAPGSFVMTANASDSDGTVTSVKFMSGTTLLYTDTSPPYSHTYSDVPAGSYALKAIATDSGGATATSAIANVTVVLPPNNLPTVTLTAPYNGAQSVAPGSFALAATASDIGGTIAKVEFKSNGVVVATKTAAPYSHTYANLAAGSYAITATATDDRGATATSTAATVTVAPAPAVSLTRTYVYDANQRLCKTINPESGATLVDYDAAGNIAWIAEGTALTSNTCDRTSVTAGQKTTRTYDERNRLKSVSTPGGTADLVTTYHPDGQVNTLTTANPGGFNVTTTYNYNKRRLLTSETSAQPGWYTWTVSYGYNANGHTSSLTYPTGLVVDFAPNALGQATKASTFASGVVYYPNGAIKQFTYGNGIVHKMTPNLRGLPARSQSTYCPPTDPNCSTPLVVLDDSYLFDENGNVTDITDQAQAGATTRGMAYDKLDRLTTALAPGMWGTALYTYDALDNLRTTTLGSAGYTYDYDSGNRLASLTRSGGGTYTYLTDPRGNITNDARQAYAFDSGNRLSDVSVSGGGLKERYRYDGMGRRVYQERPGNSLTLSQYSQAGQMLFRWDNMPSERTLEHIYLGDSLVATVDHSWPSNAITAIKYQHTDALGSPVAVTDPGRTVTERTTYSPYGAPLNRPVDGVAYTGHVIDQVTQLTYMQQRYYDPQIGRFLSVDPVESDPEDGNNFNPYWYANNNPYRFTDPDGRWAEDLVIGLPSLVMGAKSFADNFSEGNVGAAVVDGIGIVVDVAAIATPGVPGGAGAVIGAVRLGDKAVDLGKAAAGANRAEHVAKGVPASQLGPSGKPKIHVVQHATVKQSKDAARNSQGKGGTTVKHQSPKKGGPHHHGVSKKGTKDRVHHEYPKKKK